MSESAQERTAAATPGGIAELYRDYQFKLQLSGYPGIQGHFTSVRGLTVAIDTIEVREGGERQIIQHLPGQVRYGPIELLWGVSSERVLWEWAQTAAAGQPVRQNVSVVQLDSTGTREVLRCNAMDAYPTCFEYAKLDALNNNIAIAKLVLAVATLNFVYS